MFTGILTWLFSSGLSSIGKIGVDLYKEKLGAENNTETLVAGLAARELAVQQREAEVASNIVIAEQGNWATRWVRPAWAGPYVIWTYKVIVWDMVLSLGTTPEIKGFAANLGVTIAASYFGGRSIEKVASIIAQKRALTA